MPPIPGSEASPPRPGPERRTRQQTVAVVGAGGVIGSHVVPHLARDERIGRLVLIDRDHYDAGNLRSQQIVASDVGRFKAEVQGDRAREIAGAMRRDLEVISRVEDVEILPAGWLRAGVILACLDSRRARQHVNQMAWRLGVPWIDAGVLGDGLLARIDVFTPGPDTPCLECRWSDADYAALEQRYPCDVATDVGGPVPVATGAPSALGSLAASLQVLECGKLLSRDPEALGPGEQIVLDARHQRHWRTRHLPNRDCRLGGHSAWKIEPLAGTPEEITVRALLGRDPALGLRVEPQRFGTEWRCSDCGHTHRRVHLVGRAGARERRCRDCGAGAHPIGLRSVERLTPADLGADGLDTSLAELGLRPRDVVSVGLPDTETHFELATGER